MSEPRRTPRTAVIVLLALTVSVSIAASVGTRLGVPIAEHLTLVPSLVWRGEVYRLFSWVFLATDPLGLILACWMLWRFGGDLAREWGSDRFVTVFLGFAAGTGALTCLVALAWPRLAAMPLVGAWPISEAMLVAWALLYPERELYLYFVVRVSGWTAVLAVVVGTALFAFYYGLAPFVPHFGAQALMLLFMADLPRALRRVRRRLRRGRRHLRIVDDDEPPPKTPIWMN